MKKINFSFINKKLATASAAVVGVVASAGASAASNLPSTFAADMGDVKADVLLVGGALIGLALVAVGIKWVKGTILS
ncbi:major capsid protein [Cellvibrio sp.]|uniref:major capsid protein n=1 Tax=Cellvibrio sp. TaxID=1965322 RepID=UPI003964808D